MTAEPTNEQLHQFLRLREAIQEARKELEPEKSHVEVADGILFDVLEGTADSAKWLEEKLKKAEEKRYERRKMMTFQEFDKLTDELFLEVCKMRDTKGKEYAGADDSDRLANFKDIAKETGTRPLQVWYVYFKKHIRSIESFVRNEREFSDENIRGRFVDAITYLLLGYGLIAETTEPRCIHGTQIGKLCLDCDTFIEEARKGRL